MKVALHKEAERELRDESRSAIEYDDAIPPKDTDEDDLQEEGTRKKNLKSLKTSMMSKKVVSTF